MILMISSQNMNLIVFLLLTQLILLLSVRLKVARSFTFNYIINWTKSRFPLLTRLTKETKDEEEEEIANEDA